MSSDTTKNAKQGITNPKQAKRGRKDVDDADESPIDTDLDIKTMLLALSAKMDTLHDSMSSSDLRLNNKIDNLDAMMSTRINDVKVDLDNRIQEFTSDVDQRLVNAMDDAKVKCDSNVSNAMRSVNDRVDEIRAHHESRLDRLERYSLDKDIIISEANKSNYIYRFYTRRGLVYVQRHEKDRPACMFHISDLDVVFPLNNERHRNASGRRSVPTQQEPVVHPTKTVDMVNELMDTQQYSTSPSTIDSDASEQNQLSNGSNSSQANE